MSAPNKLYTPRSEFTKEVGPAADQNIAALGINQDPDFIRWKLQTELAVSFDVLECTNFDLDLSIKFLKSDIRRRIHAYENNLYSSKKTEYITTNRDGRTLTRAIQEPVVGSRNCDRGMIPVLRCICESIEKLNERVKVLENR